MLHKIRSQITWKVYLKHIKMNLKPNRLPSKGKAGKYRIGSNV